jgi:hypothetical protein
MIKPMQITEAVRQYAAKPKEFVEKGAEVYANE